MNQKTFQYWLLAARPKTLSITLAPIICASVLAYQDNGSFNYFVLLSILLSALFIQIGTNLYNDAVDFERGADNQNRLGPDRVTAKGWLSSQSVKKGALVSFSIAFICGIYLAYIGGLAIIILGLLSILSGFAYTGGPKPIAYSPLGELFVIVFFGLFAVNGSYYLLTDTWIQDNIGIGLALGNFAAAILLVNNYRDLDNDIKADKITLVYYLGRSYSRMLYGFLLLSPYLILLIMLTIDSKYLTSFIITGFSIPYAIYLIKQFYQCPISKRLNLILIKTAKLQLLYSFLFSLSLLL